jgi:SH3 domain protein
MKKIWLVIILMMLCVAEAQAERMFVTEKIDITVRSGPATENKILAMISSGDTIEVIERQQDWSLIKTASGAEGWVLNRFLMAEKPTRLLLEELKVAYDRLKAKADPLLSRNSELTRTNEQLNREVSSLSQQTETLREEIARMEQYHNIKWFIAGAGVLLAGFLIGLSARRRKRKSSLL